MSLSTTRNQNTPSLSFDDIRKVAKLASAAYNTARSVYSYLPDTKKDRAQARAEFDQFERKMANKNTKRKSGVITSVPNVMRSVTDVSKSQSGGAARQRSNTSSRVIAYSGQGSRVPKGLPGYMDKLRVCFRASTPIINNALNASALAYTIGVDSAGTDISSFMTQLTAMQGLFREFRCLKLNVDFVPRLGSIASGVVATCVDRDPRAAPIVTSGVIRKDPFFECDVKQPASLSWIPIDVEDRRFRYTTDAGRPLEFLSHGVLLVASNNDQPLGGNIGELFIDGWFEFQVPL